MIKFFLLYLFIGLSVHAQEHPDAGLVSTDVPKEFKDIGIDEKLGANLDLTVPVKDEAGNIVPLSTFFTGDKPVIFSLVYFSCPGLCNFHLNGLTEGMKKMDWQIGDKFQVVSLSIDPREGADLAAKKKATYVKLLGKPEAASGWHFLTADEPVIKALAGTVGFRYRWDEANKDWAHASAAIILTPQGKISRYLHGILFEPKDLKLALLEASSGKIGTLTDRLVWYCYRYDAHKSKYSLMAIRLVQIGGGLMVLVLAAVMVPFWWRSRKEQKPA